MRAVVVYESMFGNTHVVADAIGAGLRASLDEVTVLPVGEAVPEVVGLADLLVVGGPTHVHGLSRVTTRRSAGDQAAGTDGLELEPGADGPGLREWFTDLPAGEGRAAAAFDTRLDASAMLTGRASKGISRRLARRGYRTVLDPESFLVDSDNRLLPGEAERAAEWAAEVAARLSVVTWS